MHQAGLARIASCFLLDLSRGGASVLARVRKSRAQGQIISRVDIVDPDPAPARAAYLTGVAVAQQQKARGFELRAALSLARLYQTAGRLADARDVLGPA